MDDKDHSLAARRAAWALLNGVTEGRLLAELLPGPLAPLDPAARARAQRLATGALRVFDKADRQLGPFLRNRPDDRVLNLLRLAVYELRVAGEAPHGVVDSAVTLVRDIPEIERLSGFVNAVLRNVVRAGPEAWQALPPPRLPKWLRKVLVADYGKQAVEAMEAAHEAGAPLDLTAKADPSELAASVGGTVLPTGSVRLDAQAQVTALPGYEAGVFWVQDAAAALPARILAPHEGEAVLDLCAAPGGKTMQLAAAGAKVTALDDSPRRMERLAQNLARTGLQAECITGDVFDHAGRYDAVLLDAPCTATGTIRRHPDLPQAKDGGDFPALFELQARMIDHALTLLAPGGRLVYCTCSLLVDEGEEQVTDALARHPGLAVDPEALLVPGVEPAWRTAEGGLRLRPDYWAGRGGMDGFYIAMLRKPA